MRNNSEMKIDIDGTEFLNIINTRLESNNYFEAIEDDLLDIKESKTIHFGNIQELMTYLSFSQEDNKHYYDGLKTLIEVGMCPSCAIDIMDETIEENEYLYVELLNYLTSDAMNPDKMEVA